MFNRDPCGIKPVRKKCTFLLLTLAATAVLPRVLRLAVGSCFRGGEERTETLYEI